MIASIVAHLALYAILTAAISTIRPVASAPRDIQATHTLRVAFSNEIMKFEPSETSERSGPPRPEPRSSKRTAARPETPPDIILSQEAIPAEPAPASSIATDATAAEAAPTTENATIPAVAIDKQEDTATNLEDEAQIDPATIAGEQFKRLFSAALAYPAAARRTGKTGTVGLAVTIDAAGTVLAAGITSSSGSALLDTAAIQAAKAVPTVPAPGRPLRLAIRAVFSAGAASLES